MSETIDVIATTNEHNGMDFVVLLKINQPSEAIRNDVSLTTTGISVAMVKISGPSMIFSLSCGRGKCNKFERIAYTIKD